jgi:chromosome partitioning protein
MATSETDDRTREALDRLFSGSTLCEGLRPFVERKLRSALGEDWRAQAKLEGTKLDDPHALLGAIFGLWSRAFMDLKDDQRARAWSLELREDRNSWAHHNPMTPKDAARALDTAERLLRKAGATGQAAKIAALYRELQAIAESAPPKPPTAALLKKTDTQAAAGKPAAQTKPVDATPAAASEPDAKGAIVLILSIKGGVAKTTITLGLSEALASLGYRVLAIDADHQCALGELLLGESRVVAADKSKHTLHDLLTAMLQPELDLSTFSRYIVASGSNIADLGGRLSVLPCSFRINDFQTNRAKARQGFKTNEDFTQLLDRNRSALQRWLRSTYDFVLVDCPPSLALQVKFLLRCCTGYIIPSVPDRISVRGACWLQKRIQETASRKEALGLVWTLYRPQNERHSTTMSVVGKLAGKEDTKLGCLPPAFKTIIPNATAIVRALDEMKPVASLKAKYTSEFAGVFTSLAHEVVKATGRSSH